MKGKKGFIVTLLFFINIVMLVAAVFPHHHHNNGVICMKQDLPVQQQCANRNLPVQQQCPDRNSTAEQQCPNQDNPCGQPCNHPNHQPCNHHSSNHFPFHHPENDSCCSSECLTRFHSPIPSVQTDNGPDYVFIATLFTDVIIEHLLRPQEKRVKNYYIFRDSLHGTDTPRATSLRAPPYTVFA